MGIRDMATNLASLNLPLAGHIKHFLPNWEMTLGENELHNRLSEETSSKPQAPSYYLTKKEEQYRD